MPVHPPNQRLFNHPPPSAGPVEGLEDPAELAAYVRSHAATDSEVKTLCKDLQVRWGQSGQHSRVGGRLAWAGLCAFLAMLLN